MKLATVAVYYEPTKAWIDLNLLEDSQEKLFSSCESSPNATTDIPIQISKITKKGIKKC